MRHHSTVTWFSALLEKNQLIISIPSTSHHLLIKSLGPMIPRYIFSFFVPEWTSQLSQPPPHPNLLLYTPPKNPKTRITNIYYFALTCHSPHSFHPPLHPSTHSNLHITKPVHQRLHLAFLYSSRRLLHSIASSLILPTPNLAS